MSTDRLLTAHTFGLRFHAPEAVASPGVVFRKTDPVVGDAEACTQSGLESQPDYDTGRLRVKERVCESVVRDGEKATADILRQSDGSSPD